MAHSQVHGALRTLQAVVIAMFCLFVDPWLESKAALWGYSGAVAGAILPKGVAGWFWAEHFRVELLGYGAGQPPQTSQESHAVFYATRRVVVLPAIRTASTAARAAAEIPAAQSRMRGANRMVTWWSPGGNHTP